MCGTASRMIFAKLKTLRSSGGWSTHGAAIHANVQCSKVNQFYFAFAYISFYSTQFAFYLLCFALLCLFFILPIISSLLCFTNFLFIFSFLIILFNLLG